MIRTIRWSGSLLFCGMMVMGITGCQTYEVGQVLPSPYHLMDDPQYFPKGPDFPLANELNSMSDAEEEHRKAQR
jgi:hypothetical protein